MQCFRVLAVSALLFCFFPSWSKAELGALDVFIESCRNSGENINLIQSGYAEFESSRESHFRSEQAQERLKVAESKMREAFEAQVRKSLADAPPGVLRREIEGIKEMKLFTQQGKTDFRHKLFFTGNDIFFNLNDAICKRYRVTEQFAQGKWGLNDFVIMEGSPNGTMVLASFMPGTRTATVEAVVQPGYEFQRFGRMHMSSTYHSLLACMESQDRKEFQITDKAVEVFKEKMKGKNYSFEIAGTASYDDNQTATVVEIKSEGRVIERFWIDTARGYICPLIQCFDEDGALEREAKSSGYFLHDKTDLFYPERYEETRLSPMTGTTVTAYTLNRATFQLNHAVSDKMFTLDIPEGTKVIDKRTEGEEINYRAMDKGELSLAKSGLDLDKMEWLWREGDLSFFDKPPSSATQWLRGISILLGVFFIAFALFIKFRRYLGINE